MIRVQDFDVDNFIPILSGLLCEETTADSYVFVNTITKLMPPSEANQEAYLILSVIEQFYMIYSRADLLPAITKETLLDAIDNNLYEELKENKRAGFQQYASTNCHVELDPLQEEVIGLVADSLLQSIEIIFDQAIELSYTLNRSISELLSFNRNYKSAVIREAGRLMEMMSNSDMHQVRLHFWGWSFFLSRHRIYSLTDAGVFLNLVADHLNTKDRWASLSDAPLTSIDQVIAAKNRYIENSTPFFVTPFEAFNQHIKFVGGEITTLAASKGVGKTTFASMISGVALAQGLRVIFYSPETGKEKMLFENIYLSYIRAKYGFAVTANQVLELEQPFESGSEYTQEEKRVLIEMAKVDLASEGNFFHIQEYLEYKTMKDDFRAITKSFRPDLIFIDHTLEVRGDASGVEKTSRFAETMKSIAKDFNPHIFMLSHPGSRFKDAIPTPEEPIKRDVPIVAQSQDSERLAENVMGAVKGANNEFKIFFTKLRNGVIPPMFLTLRMLKLQGWFEYRPEDQFTQSTSTQHAIDAIMSGTGLLMEDEIDLDDLDEDDI